jgi:hypothetical protein
MLLIVWLRWCKMYHHWLIYIYILLDPYLNPVYHTNWHRPCLQLGLEDEFPVNIGYSMGKLLLWGRGYVTSFRQSGDRLVDNPIEVYLQSPYTRVIFTITIPITVYESLYINFISIESITATSLEQWHIRVTHPKKSENSGLWRFLNYYHLPIYIYPAGHFPVWCIGIMIQWLGGS